MVGSLEYTNGDFISKNMENKRKYLLYDDVSRDSSLRPVFDACIAGIVNKEILHVSKTRADAGYPSYPCFRVNGKEILVGAALEYYLYELGKSGFQFEKAHHFTEIMRKLCGWQWEVDRTLRGWIERVIQAPFFYNAKQEGDWYSDWKLKPGEPSYRLPEDFFKFACYIAVCHVKFGMSHDKYTADEIFKYVTALGCDIPLKLKKQGSGDLPREVLEYKDTEITCKANDVFATIRITLKEESEDNYRKVLDYLCRLLESEFPRSYAIDFRSPGKNWLPVKGLPKKGVHQLFANAVQWSALHPRIECYARLAMREDEWYINLEDEYCAMPGTFAVFALGIMDERYHDLVCDYLKTCDGEHQGLQGQFVLSYIEKYGFTMKGLELYTLCDENIQHLPQKLIALRNKFRG